MQFHTRPRLIQHLTYDNVVCRSSFLAGEELSVEHTRLLDAADAVQAKANRRAGLPQRFASKPAV